MLSAVKAYLRKMLPKVIAAQIRRPYFWLKEQYTLSVLKGIYHRGESHHQISSFSKTVDIIVPVYNGYEYLQPLIESVIGNTSVSYHLYCIDDASTDTRIIRLLLEYEERYPELITIIQHDDNIGFVQTVNEGLTISSNDVVILNSDVVVPPNWLNRIMHPFLINSNVASVTPMSNSATICSFPTIGEDNEIFAHQSVKEVDKIFQRVKPQKTNYIPTPTGVGFCMAMSRKAIEEIGYFDADTFGKGYGEENDWCMRAKSKGYQHYIATTVFVYHNHGGSFPDEQKQKLLLENEKKIREKHPTYWTEAAGVFENRKYRKLRQYLQIIAAAEFADSVKIIFAHAWGGGAEKYLQGLITEHPNDAFIVVRYVNNRFMIETYYKDYQFDFSLFYIESIWKLLEYIEVEEVIINELIDYPQIDKVLASIVQAKKKYKFPLHFIAHDFYSICPTINLLDNEEKWCGVPNIEVCKKCIKTAHIHYPKRSITFWRKNWQAFFGEIDKFIVFSNFTERIFLRAYNIDGNKIMRSQLKTRDMRKVSIKNKGTKEVLKIGIPGVITRSKGIKIVNSMLDYINGKKYPLELVILGYVSPEFYRDDHIISGSYNPKELPKLVEKYQIDIIFIPSIWGETFSYTTRESIEMGMPVATFDLGAQADQVKKYDKGIIIPEISADKALEVFMDYFKKKDR